MRPIEIPLTVGSSRFGKPRHLFDPEFERVPVNQRDHAQRQQRVLEQKPSERTVRQGAGRAGQCAGESTGVPS